MKPPHVNLVSTSQLLYVSLVDILKRILKGVGLVWLVFFYYF